MTVTVAKFRQDFPEFADVTKLSDATIQFNLNMAYLLLTERWDSTIIDLGAELFAAHQLVLSMRNQRTVSIGGIPGQTGIIASKTVGGVSVAYNNLNAFMADWGYFNLSDYGTRFAFLANIVGMGGFQAGIWLPGSVPLGVINDGNLLGQD